MDLTLIDCRVDATANVALAAHEFDACFPPVNPLSTCLSAFLEYICIVVRSKPFA